MVMLNVLFFVFDGFDVFLDDGVSGTIIMCQSSLIWRVGHFQSISGFQTDFIYVLGIKTEYIV